MRLVEVELMTGKLTEQLDMKLVVWKKDIVET
jgi:hypothetical protein